MGAVEDLELRAVIYRRILDTGTPPSRAQVVEAIGDPEEADARLRRLHDAHMIVLDDRPHDAAKSEWHSRSPVNRPIS